MVLSGSYNWQHSLNLFVVDSKTATFEHYGGEHVATMLPCWLDGPGCGEAMVTAHAWEGVPASCQGA